MESFPYIYIMVICVYGESLKILSCASQKELVFIEKTVSTKFILYLKILCLEIMAFPNLLGVSSYWFILLSLEMFYFL